MAYGRRVVGIVLSGMLQDGTAGLWQIRKRGGVTIAQDPRDAEFASMPQTAIDNLAVDFILPVEGIAQKLIALTREEDVDLPGRAEPVGVLLVGDAGPDARCLEERLPSFGYHVIGVARSGDEAVKIAQRERPDIVIMDVYMEQASGGITAGRKIWQELQVPVIYATAFSDPNTLNLVKNSANYGYLLKPFRPEAVDAAIQLALDRREKELRHLQT
jgi:chemotaxis response regulator CheB